LFNVKEKKNQKEILFVALFRTFINLKIKEAKFKVERIYEAGKNKLKQGKNQQEGIIFFSKKKFFFETKKK